MRVIAGTARRLLLKTLPGDDTRPTTDKIKETLFNMINFDLPGARFLDLFAGSGAIGIEALSRGAVFATFVDNNPKASAVIRDNLAHTHLDEQSEIITSDAASAVRRLAAMGTKPYDIIFLDPPYNNGLADTVLANPSFVQLLSDSALIIVEMSIGEDVEHFEDLGYNITRTKEYKSNKHVFLRRKA